MLLFMMSALKKEKTRYNKGKRKRERATPYFFFSYSAQERASTEKESETDKTEQPRVGKNSQPNNKTKANGICNQQKKKQGQIHLSNTTPEMT